MEFTIAVCIVPVKNPSWPCRLSVVTNESISVVMMIRAIISTKAMDPRMEDASAVVTNRPSDP